MSTETITPAYRLDTVADVQRIVLRDLGGVPNVRKEYGSIDIVITAITIEYARPGKGAWHVSGIRVDGYRAKKDGTAGGQQADTNWWEPMAEEGPYSHPAPRWLQTIALRHMPNDSRTAAYLPGMPGADSAPADATDLDTLEG